MTARERADERWFGRDDLTVPGLELSIRRHPAGRRRAKADALQREAATLDLFLHGDGANISVFRKPKDSA